VAPPIDDLIRRAVAERARGRCEYCLLSEEDGFHPHQIDHIVSRKHGGDSEPSNLAFASIGCNLWKGTDIASLDPLTVELVPLFNPRTQRWTDHFQINGAVFEPLTPIARATARLLRLNLDQRVVERRMFLATGRSNRPLS
jgi:hypothetical protein